jgi:acetoin utilization deacetylase AcuC-like enzyme
MLYYTDPGCLAHDVMPDHPERPDRLRAISQRLAETGLLDDLHIQQVQPLDISQMHKAHSTEHVAFLQQMSPQSGTVSIDPDTHMCVDSLVAAQLAAGAVTQAVDAVLGGQDKRAFCAVRPPGHHAERNDAMGFCLFNSIALGALSALEQPGIERVAILDFDVHHGNGTVDIFRDDPRVLVCSSYQYPFYPNRMADVQAEHIIHTPLAAGTGSRDFRVAIERDWLPALSLHQPQLILVSAGFDAHMDDPLAQLELSTDDYRWVTELIMSAANNSAKGRVVSALEGGYDLEALAASAAIHVETLASAS